MKIKKAKCFIALALSLALCSCSSVKDSPPAPEALQPVAAAVQETFITTYTATLDIDPINRYITGVQKVKYKNQTDTDLDHIYFGLYLNAFRPGVRPLPYLSQIESKIFENGTDYGYIDIQNVTINQNAVAYETYGAVLKVTLPQTLPIDDETEIVLQFKAYIPKINHRTGANDFAVWCGNFLPNVSVYDANGWNTAAYYPAGDPFYTEIANYNITINTPHNYTVVATGVEDIAETPDGATTTMNAKLVRDFAFAVSDRYIKSTLVTTAGVEINFYTYSRDIDTAYFLKTAEESLDYFSALISNYPYRQLDIIETEMFSSGGQEYPQLIFMDSDYMHTEAAYKNLVHQICHQWFYGIVGNNQIKEAWLDEGLVSYLQEGVYLISYQVDQKMVSDKNALQAILPDIENKRLTSDISVYKRWSDYYNIQYTRGKLMFDGLHHKMGEDKFNEFLRLYYLKYSYKTASGKGMIETAEEVYGEDLSDFFENWMNGDGLPPY